MKNETQKGFWVTDVFSESVEKGGTAIFEEFSCTRQGEIASSQRITSDSSNGPFGEVVKSSGSYAAENVFSFSTKYADTETGLHYYGYRYYNAETGRWLNRDSIQEYGGLGIYSFLDNSVLVFFDSLGRAKQSVFVQGPNGSTVQFRGNTTGNGIPSTSIVTNPGNLPSVPPTKIKQPNSSQNPFNPPKPTVPTVPGSPMPQNLGPGTTPSTRNSPQGAALGVLNFLGGALTGALNDKAFKKALEECAKAAKGLPPRCPKCCVITLVTVPISPTIQTIKSANGLLLRQSCASAKANAPSSMMVPTFGSGNNQSVQTHYMPWSNSGPSSSVPTNFVPGGVRVPGGLQSFKNVS